MPAFALLEAATAPDTQTAHQQPTLAQKAKLWLVATHPVTAALRWRAGAIRGHVAGDGAHSLELDTGGRRPKAGVLASASAE